MDVAVSADVVSWHGGQEHDGILVGVQHMAGAGMMSRSPVRPSHVSVPVVSCTRPLSTYTVASPGFSCSPSEGPASSATTIWRSACSWPPKTVAEDLDARDGAGNLELLVGERVEGLSASVGLSAGTRRGHG
jgi:hypothetical protein